MHHFIFFMLEITNSNLSISIIEHEMGNNLSWQCVFTLLTPDSEVLGSSADNNAPADWIVRS
jgi:hypothetical protein